MDFAQQLRVLQAAQGDPAKLALTAVDLAYPSLLAAERFALKQSLEAAAIPHWCDESILATLLEIPKHESAALFDRLRGLSVLEPFPARGDTTMNVHETARLALRKRMAADENILFRSLSGRAAVRFEEDCAPAGRVEWIYHLLCSDPERGAVELESLNRNWGRCVRPEDRYALASALRELEDTGLVQGRARVWVLLINAWESVSRGEVVQLEDDAGKILNLARAEEDPRAEANTQSLLGELFKAQGKLEAAQVAFEEDLAISRLLADQDPNNAGWQLDLAMAHGRIGDLLKAQGKLEAAEAAFEEALAISQGLAEQDPSNTGWKLELAVAQNRIGDVLKAQGKLEAAEAAFGEALAISRRLAERDASNTGWQWEFAWAQNRIGDVLQAQGKSEAAQTAFGEALAISRRLAEQAVAQNKIGDVLQAQGKLEAAQTAFAEALAISRRLAEQDPSNTGWQWELAVAHSRIGDVLQAQGKPQAAQTAYGQYLWISRSFVEQDSSNADLRRDWAVTYSKMGDALQAQGKLIEARTAFEQSASIIWRLIEQDPGNASLHLALASVHGRVGEMLQGWLKTSQLGRLTGDLFGPSETTLKEMELIRSSVSEDIKHVAYQELIAYSSDDAVPETILRNWYIQNPNGFNMILYGDKKIGHLNLLPFKESFLAKFAEGKVIEKDAKADDIYPPESQESIKDLYVESLAILHPFENWKGRILSQVLSQFANIVSRVCPPDQVRYVYALAATKPGKKLLSRLCFSDLTTEHPRKDGLSFFGILYTDLIQVLSKFKDNTKA